MSIPRIGNPRPTKISFEFVPRNTEKSEFVDLVEFVDSFARVMSRVHLLVSSYTFMSKNHGTHSYEGVMVCMYLYLYV